MLILLSPAKSLDFSPIDCPGYSQPRLLEKTEELVGVMRKKSRASIQELMGVSEKIADLNYHRYRDFSLPFTLENAKPSMYAFNGDVYTGLEAQSFNQKEVNFAQKHLRLLSGLYGVLKPLDLIQPYRLEMGTKLKHRRNKNLYEFWDTTITELLNEDLAESGGDVVVNLASNEYFNSVKKDHLNGRVLDVDFRENRDGKLKVISFNAKKARGRMTHLIVKEGLTQPEQLKELVVNDYVFSPEHSTEDKYTFIKE
jgi:cytoplasmic iron level regulating protein YaaA (DUF328/UPF0246 family)